MSPLALPAWREDETLYSWAANFHKEYGFTSAKRSGQLMFGRPQACRQHELPAGISFFVHWSRGLLGSAEDLLSTRTTLGEWRVFLPEGKWRSLISQIELGQASSVRTTAGLTASGLGGVRAMRFCPDCVRRRFEKFGAPTWRASHQGLASWACLEHGRVLVEVVNRSAGWSLPPMAWSETCELDVRVAMLLSSVSTEFDKHQRHIDVAAHAALARQSLVDAGVCRSPLRISDDDVTNWFQRTRTSKMIRVKHGSSIWTGDWLRLLLRGRRVGSPFVWKALWAAILEEETEETVRSVLRTLLAKGLRPDGSQQELFQPTDSLKVASQLEAQLQSGASLAEMATALGVSKVTVRRWMSQIPGLHVRRMEKRIEQRKVEILQRAQHLMSAHPAMTRTALMSHMATDVEWLRINEPGLLRRLLDQLPSRRAAQLAFF